MKKFITISIICSLIFIGGCSEKNHIKIVEPGLIGAYYGNADLTRIKSSEVLPDLDRVWDEETGSGHGSSWSGKYEGYIIAPTAGEITFHLETNQEAKINLDADEMHVWGEQSIAVLMKYMQKGSLYPISIVYLHATKGVGYLKLSWSYNGQDKTAIPAENFGFTAEQAAFWHYPIEPDPGSIDKSKFTTVPVKHVLVFDEPGRFGGWPANNGIWSWGDEIVVGFVSGYYQASDLHHSIDKTKPQAALLARSVDGGETWSIENPENFVDDGGKLLPRSGDINFTHPDFAMRCGGNQFFVSYNRCRTWQGPFLFPDFGREKLTARTDYIVNGKEDCLFMISTEELQVEARLQDLAFCAQTVDGGKSIEFLSWITDPIQVRSVMPSTVKIADNHLVTALRRRHDKPFADRPPLEQNWIDVYESLDNGKTWKFLNKVANTDRGKHNGNPPSLVKLNDGRLCVTYGYRSVPYGIRAKISEDNGKTWSQEINLRENARTWDIGYTRSVQRADGKIVTIYYYTTEEHVEQHIAATIWEPVF